MKISYNKTFFFLFLCLLSFLTVSFNNVENEHLIKKKNTKSRPANEILYVHTDRSAYVAGDTIWFKAYMFNSETLKTSYESNLLNVQLYTKTGKKILNQKHKLSGGITSGYMTLPDSLTTGNYLFVTYPNLIDSTSFDNVFSKTINLYALDEQNAKIKLFIPDTIYDKGNVIEGTIELVNNSNQKYADTQILLQLQNSDSTIAKSEINTGKKGIQNFSIEIPKIAHKKALFLKASTVNSVLKAQVKFAILHKLSPPDIQFLPESGVAIENIELVIAFKAVDINGDPFEFIGNIIDKNNKLIKTFSSKYAGMGKFNIEYSADDSLYCKIIKPIGYQKKYFLPHPEINAHTINVKNSVNNSLEIKLSTNKNNNDTILNLLLLVNDKVYFSKKVNIKKKDSLIIDTEKIPQGIAEIGIFDVNEHLLAERIVFINKKTRMKIIGVKQEYKTKEKVSFVLNASNKQFNNDKLNFSLSVSLINPEEIAENEKNILSTILLKKKLVGNIPNPGFYFSKHPNANESLDLLILTQGWRKVIPKNRNKTTEHELSKQVSDISIEGQIVKPNGKPVKFAEVILINYKSFSVAKTIADKKGYFIFNTIDYMMVADNDSIVITATGPNDNKKVKIKLKYPYQTKISNRIKQQQKTPKLTNNVLSKQYHNPKKTIPIITNDNTYSGFNKKDIKIKDVDVKAKRLYVIPKEIYEKKYISHKLEEKDIQFSVTAQKRGGMFLGLLQKAAGTFVYLEDQGLVLFRGYNSIFGKQNGAAIVVDGVFIGTDLRRLDALNPLNVESIKVTKSSAAGLRYTPFAAGLIEVKMKGKFVDMPKKSTKTAMNLTQIGGFKTDKEFYLPIYNKLQVKQKVIDLRKTIFWKPNIKLDETGKVNINFYTSEISGKYMVILEGVSKQGKILYLNENFKVD